MSNPQLQDFAPGWFNAVPTAITIDFLKWKIFDANGKELAQLYRVQENVWGWGTGKPCTDEHSIKLEQLYHAWLGRQVVE